jgi:tetrathionate reductase subunit B
VARFGMLIDLRTCIGCHACSVACKAEFNVPLGVFRDSVKYIEAGTYPEVRRHFIPVLCNHCEDAPCLNACPTSAISRASNGEVVIDKDRCNGVRACISACPYGAIYIDPVERVAQKCTFCEHRTAVGRAPACVEACPTHCRTFGDLDDPTSAVSKKIATNEVVAWKADEKTKPKVLYVDPRGALAHARQVGVQMDKQSERAQATSEDSQ